MSDENSLKGRVTRQGEEAIGRFAAQKIFEDAVIVLTSDHGESLGDHGEETHGYFIYQSTLWVPLIIQWPGGDGHHQHLCRAGNRDRAERRPSHGL